ncbi:type II toxin-antitoxin system HigB family toxin [Dolichospermum sp. LEGE 00246]|uniref:type II toxin-antitoxin system HigB family toxin n=1 Tax=Dolichospermum sp. LEGE 00246 TaxID=1828605 RepID=UPI00351C8EDB
MTVFNIGGNKVRLIAAIHYNRKKIYIRAVLTHPEYDRCGNLSDSIVYQNLKVFNYPLNSP